MRIQPCPINFPAGYYWYGLKRTGPGRHPKWVDRLMATDEPTMNNQDDDDPEEAEPESETVTTGLDHADSNEIDATEDVNNPNSKTKKMKTRTMTINPPARYQSDSA